MPFKMNYSKIRLIYIKYTCISLVNFLFLTTYNQTLYTDKTFNQYKSSCGLNITLAVDFLKVAQDTGKLSI